VLTHNPPDRWVGPGTGGAVVTDGIESALEQARAVAGDKVTSILAANVVQQFLMAGLLDEIRLNVVPVLLGGGVRLLDTYGGPQFDLEPTLVVESDDVTDLRYRVSR
jgi:dihydrofolate reductase